MIVRSSGRRALLGVLSAALVLAACGGSSGSKASSTTTTRSGATTTSAASSGGTTGKCYTTPGKQTARVRFVNLFTNATYKDSAIDVWQGSGADDGCGKKLATVPYGSASDYVDVTASDTSGNWSATAFITGSADNDHEIISQSETWKGGEQVTIVFQGAEPQTGTGLPPSAGGDQTFFETGTADSPPSLAPKDGKAVVGIAATSLQYVMKDGAWVAALDGQSGCLKAVGDTDSTRANIGGTQLVTYVLDPGSLKVSLFDSQPGTCAGTPAIGPATLDASAGSRTYVFAYGTDAQSLKLLVLPIPSS